MVRSPGASPSDHQEVTTAKAPGNRTQPGHYVRSPHSSSSAANNSPGQTLPSPGLSTSRKKTPRKKCATLSVSGREKRVLKKIQDQKKGDPKMEWPKSSKMYGKPDGKCQKFSSNIAKICGSSNINQDNQALTDYINTCSGDADEGEGMLLWDNANNEDSDTLFDSTELEQISTDLNVETNAVETPPNATEPTSSKKALNTGKKPTKSKAPKLEMSFVEGHLKYQQPEEEVQFTAEKVKKPIDYSLQFFTNEMFDTIYKQSNLYYLQKTGEEANLTRNDIKKFVGLELIMGVVRMPAYTDYWNKKWRYDPVCGIFSLNEYKHIRRCLHFVDQELTGATGLNKIRELLNSLNIQCQNVPNERFQSIDEIMLPYKGLKAGILKQFMPSKPTKYGFKFYARAGNSGMLYHTFMYEGSTTMDQFVFTEKEKQLFVSGQIIMALAKSINVEGAVKVPLRS